MDEAHLSSPLGTLKICGDDQGIRSVTFTDQPQVRSDEIPASLIEAVSQLKAYFQKKIITFNLNLQPDGTQFQQKVWKELQQIPFGKTISYTELAHRLGDPKVIRAAASANGKNPIAVIIPCHRVVGSDGSLTGYAGGLDRKKWLLDHESPVVQETLF